MRKTEPSDQMKKMSLGCEAVECNFQTPNLDIKNYPAMVQHLQLHSHLVHGVEMPGVGSACPCQRHKDGAGQTLPPSSEKPRDRTRSRSRRRSNVEEFDFPCPDCNLQSFATEAGLYQHRRKYCGLRGVEPSGLDFLCQGEGCGRAFSNPAGLATHRRSCKTLLALAVDDNSSSEGGPGREGVRDREKRSRSTMPIEVRDRTRAGLRDRERSRSGKGVAQSGNDKWVDEDSGSHVNGSRSSKSSKKGRGSRSLTLGDCGSTSTSGSRSSERGAVPVQRSTTFNNLRATGEEASSSSSRGDCTGDFKVEMEVLMRLSNGKMVTTKYKVSSQTLMQSVIVKVANKMEREVKKVKLYRQADFGPGLEVPATSTAVNFGGSRLYAEVV